MRSAGSVLTAALLLVGCGAMDTGAGSGAIATAPPWLIALDGTGTWQDPDDDGVVRGWVDARVANLRYHKRVFVEVAAPYGAVFMRTLVVADFEAARGDGAETWGTDAIEIYPQGGPNGAALSGVVVARLRIQHDLEGDGTDEMVVTDWFPIYGDGEVRAPDAGDDPWAPGAIASPARGDGFGTKAWFAPFDDPGRDVVARIDALIEAKRAAPGVRRTLHAAVFNITDDEIVAKLIEAHLAGVEVRLVFDGRKFRPWYDWYQGDDRLLEAGVPLLGVRRSESGAMHDKIALFDGDVVATGSFNWEHGARFENHENMVTSGDPALLAAYARRFEAVAGGVQHRRLAAVRSQSEASVSFAPDEEPHRIVGELIDAAQESVYVAMFTAKDVAYRDASGETSLLRKLVRARQRGVDVRVIVDHGIHEASEYYGTVTEDDPTDEWLEDQGVHVVRADNPFGRYASMHHKFVVVDGEIVVTGAFNWYYDAAFRNDEDQLVLRDPHIASSFTGEIVDLLRRYDDDYQPGDWPAVDLELDVEQPETAWGDIVYLVGDLPELGAWSIDDGIVLDGGTWPTWRGTVTLPIGTRAEYKLAVKRAGGEVDWEWGANRSLTMSTDVGRMALQFRR